MVLSNDFQDQIKCKVIDFNSQEQLESLDLRRRILRKPLGIDFDEDDLKLEKDEIHIAAFLNSKLVGILLFKVRHEDGKQILKMRQVAVDEEVQGLGVGSVMVRFSEQWAIGHGYDVINLHARKTAVEFDHRLGYQTTGDEFQEVGIPHYKMFKILNPMD